MLSQDERGLLACSFTDTLRTPSDDGKSAEEHLIDGRSSDIRQTVRTASGTHTSKLVGLKREALVEWEVIRTSNATYELVGVRGGKARTSIRLDDLHLNAAAKAEATAVAASNPVVGTTVTIGYHFMQRDTRHGLDRTEELMSSVLHVSSTWFNDMRRRGFEPIDPMLATDAWLSRYSA